MEVRAKRVGGAAYQVPMQVRGERKESLAIRWLVAAARAKSNSEFHTYAEKIAQELMDAAKAEGGAVRKGKKWKKLQKQTKRLVTSNGNIGIWQRKKQKNPQWL